MLDQATSFDTSGDGTTSGTTSGDNVVALSRMLADIERLWQQIERDRERLEETLPVGSPGRSRTTWIEIGRLRCGSPDEVRQHAARHRIDAEPLVARWEALERQRIADRRRIGLDRLDLADRMARSGYMEIRNQIARTAAISAPGIAAKIQLLVSGLRDGPCGDELAIAESALCDLARLGAE